MSEQLHEVLADLRGDAAVLRRNHHEREAEFLEGICDRVKAAAEEYLTFLAEPDAALRTGKAVKTLRARAREWEEQGHAKKIGRVWYYRMVVLPPRANLSAAREAGRRAAEGVQ